MIEVIFFQCLHVVRLEIVSLLQYKKNIAYDIPIKLYIKNMEQSRIIFAK